MRVLGEKAKTHLGPAGLSAARIVGPRRSQQLASAYGLSHMTGSVSATREHLPPTRLGSTVEPAALSTSHLRWLFEVICVPSGAR